MPIVGTFIGGLPLIGIATIVSSGKGMVLLAVFLVLQVLIELSRYHWVEKGSVRVGPFLASAGVIAGLEWRGAEGAVLAFLGLAVVLAAVDELSMRSDLAGNE